MGKERPGSIEGKLVGIIYNYLNRNFESSEITIHAKMENYKGVDHNYYTDFYGFIPKDFLGKTVHLGQTVQEGSKRVLYQLIYQKRNPNYMIDSHKEDFSE